MRNQKDPAEKAALSRILLLFRFEIPGTFQTMYAQYERGANELPIRHLIRLAELYGVSTDNILGRPNGKDPL